MRTLTTWCALALALLPSAFAKQTCDASITRAVALYRANDSDATLKFSLSVEKGGATCIVALILSQSDSLSSIEANLPAIKAALQQLGASSGSGGSTNLVSKGIAAEVLSAAAEYGALAETTNNQTVTLQGSLGTR